MVAQGNDYMFNYDKISKNVSYLSGEILDRRITMDKTTLNSRVA